ncbi:MAG: hypothetical protein PVI57_09130 [Gemmatimonadota bacterium]|jgi:hypothetical protein
MRRTHLGRHALVLLLSVGLVACGDDSSGPGNEGDQLTEAEATVMIEALVAAGGFAFGTLGGGPAAAPGKVVFGPITLELTENCPRGGTIGIQGTYSGDVDNETGLGTASFQFVQSHNACSAEAPSDGSIWTFNGSPDITIDFNYTIGATSFSLDGSQTGGIAFSGAGKTGTCAIDLDYDFSGSQDGTTFSGSVSGSVCGISVSETVTISD